MRWCDREPGAADSEPPLKKLAAPVREDEFDQEEHRVAALLLLLRGDKSQKIFSQCNNEFLSPKARNGHMGWCSRGLPQAAADPPLRKRAAPVREDEFDEEEHRVVASLLLLQGDQSDEMASFSDATAGGVLMDLNMTTPEEKAEGLERLTYSSHVVHLLV